MSLAQKIRSIPSRLLHRLAAYEKKGIQGLQERMPGYFGFPIESPLMQFYRQDGDFSTVADVSNYLSFFASYPDVVIDFIFTAYDAAGRKLGTAVKPVGAFASASVPLASLFPRLDAYGIYTVRARYRPGQADRIAFLKETSPQFMTCFMPARAGGTPQMIHSHKTLDRLAAVRKHNERISKVTEDLSALERIEVFVLNSTPNRLDGRLRLVGADETPLFDTALRIPPRGVGKADWAVGGASLPDGAPFGYYRAEYSRLSNHRKPIIFRHFKNGAVSANHS